MTGQWMAPRHTAPGFFSALLEFENGACATLVYSAYGYFMASEFFEPGAGVLMPQGCRSHRGPAAHHRRDERRGRSERATHAGGAEDWADNRSRRPVARFLSDLGLLVVSCEHGDMRQSPAGIYIYSDTGTTEVPLTETRAPTPRNSTSCTMRWCTANPCCTAAAGGWRRWRSASPSCSRRRHIGTSRCSTRLPFLRACSGKIS